MLVKSTQSLSFEPKFHDNYLAFLEKVGLDSLYHEVLLTTCVISKALLSPETLSHPTFNQVPPGRTLPSSEFLLRVLKNLGRWLGKLVVTTKSFLSKTDIDLKSLIVEAYKLGLLTKTIPFVLEFLEPCSKCPLFKLSNPWTMMILKLLYEIYMMSNMQEKLRLSIEGSLEKFGVLEQLKPTSVLREKHRTRESSDGCFPMTKAKENPLDVAPDRIDLLMYSREKFSEEFLVTIKKSSSFFGNYPELERKMKDLVLQVLKKFGPLLIKLAATVAHERAKAAFFMINGPLILHAFNMVFSKIFLGGWMSYLVGDLLQKHDVAYGLQSEIVEGVIDDNLECICERLGEKQIDSWALTSHKNLVDEISHELVKDVTVDAMSNFLETVREISAEEKLAALFKVVCDQFDFQKDPPSICMYTKKMAYLDPLLKGENGRMQDLMHALEYFCRNSSFSRGLEDLIVDGFRRTGYLNEAAILQWFEQGRTRAENRAQPCEKLRDPALEQREMQLDQLFSQI
ncbi:hypothetical protein F2Q69_00063291 [Brassica cretica]|uniref:CCR4-NOT transcription complex subunit 1 CAF1-binding domain-containing protein n=2 Tax=Brassica TaxID=3705 RepID=A0A8S9RF29_BRACR|nr:hypothetical protein F2Q69_00063291 [Brassica cretica]